MVELVTFQVARQGGLVSLGEWMPVGRQHGTGTEPTLCYGRPGEPPAIERLRNRLGAGSVVVAPIVTGGAASGWLVMATGPQRRGFRPSGARLITDLSARLGVAIERVELHGKVVAAGHKQERTNRRVRRLAAAAANLAGAGTTEGVLRVGCVEACIIEDADATAACWTYGNGESVSAVVGVVDAPMLEEALAAGLKGQVCRGPGWIVYPLACTDDTARAALAVFSAQALDADQEMVLDSLTSFVPVAFERAESVSETIRHEAWMRAVLECSPVALMGMGSNGSVVWANTVAQDLLATTDGGGPGTLREALREIAGTVRLSRSVEHHELTETGLDLAISAAPMQEAPGQEDVVVAAVTDMTERRAAERALLQAQRLEAMGQVAGGVAHDFNNLLTVISGYAEIISRTIDDEQVRPLIGNIEKAANRAAALTQQLLGFTRHSAASAVVLDLGEAVRALRPVLDRLAGPSVVLGIEEPHREVMVLGDPAEAEQAVLNLVINACDAMDGEGTLRICIEPIDLDEEESAELGLPAGTYAQLAVSDTGSGMSAEAQSRCLEPFFTTKDRGQGSGLGLWTVYAMASERGGTLRIESAPGVGTTVRLLLPRCEGDEAEPLSSDAPALVSGEMRSGGVVLLVEDEDEVRQLTERALKAAGLDVVSASHAEDALLLALTCRFDVVVTDIVLPGMSGVDLAERLRRERPALAVLYVSGYADLETRKRGVGEGIRLLRKPYRLDELCAEVVGLVEMAQAAPGEGITPAAAKAKTAPIAKKTP